MQKWVDFVVCKWHFTKLCKKCTHMHSWTRIEVSGGFFNLNWIFFPLPFHPLIPPSHFEVSSKNFIYSWKKRFQDAKSSETLGRRNQSENLGTVVSFTATSLTLGRHTQLVTLIHKSQVILSWNCFWCVWHEMASFLSEVVRGTWKGSAPGYAYRQARPVTQHQRGQCTGFADGTKCMQPHPPALGKARVVLSQTRRVSFNRQFKEVGPLSQPHFTETETEFGDAHLRSGESWAQKWAVETQKKPVQVSNGSLHSHWTQGRIFKQKSIGSKSQSVKKPPSLRKTRNKDAAWLL